MGPVDCLILAALALLLILAVVRSIRGRGACCGDCSRCAARGSCRHKDEKKK